VPSPGVSERGPAPREPLDENLYWQDSSRRARTDIIPLLFVSEEKDAVRWAALPEFWNPSLAASVPGVASLVRPMPPLELALLLAVSGPAHVEIKVPRGLPDPTPHLPTDDPPTLGKWQLGRRLFFDAGYLTASKDVSCTTCHNPKLDFASRQGRDGRGLRLNTPSLWNVAYQPRIFWDGRGETLESCLQQTFEDEREPTPAGKHAWGGAITRLIGSSVYRVEFEQVFGVWPNQDNVGRALATYLRTLLSGNSVVDRALAGAKAAGKADPEASHFAAALAGLVPPMANPADAAREIHRGYDLFHDRVGTAPTACMKCHGGPLATDRGYHNLGFHVSTPTNYAGRMATLPPGQRNLAALGAFRTPSLRNVTRTSPYFHTGDVASLEDAVRYHLKGASDTSYTDPLFRTEMGARLERPLSDEDVRALLRYLEALDGEPMPSVLIQPVW